MPLIRPMQPADAAAAARLLDQLGYPASTDEVLQRAAQLTRLPDNIVLVAEDSGRITGLCQLLPRLSLTAGPHIELAALVVSPEHRGHGTGKALVQAAIDWCRAKGYGKLSLRSAIQREAAHAFYRAQGFTQGKQSYRFDMVL